MTLSQDLQQRIERSALLAEVSDSEHRRLLAIGRMEGLQEALRAVETHRARHRAERRKQ